MIFPLLFPFSRFLPVRPFLPLISTLTGFQDWGNQVGSTTAHLLLFPTHQSEAYERYFYFFRAQQHQHKLRRDDPPLRESSVDTESILVDADTGLKRPFVTSTVVGVGLGGKTCISVNDDSRHNDATSVKIWTSTSTATSTSTQLNAADTSTTFVQTTAIVHSTPPV